jgi:hypothetical protein
MTNEHAALVTFVAFSRFWLYILGVRKWLLMV